MYHSLSPYSFPNDIMCTKAPVSYSGFICVTPLDALRCLSPPLQVRGSEPDSVSISRGQRSPSPRASKWYSPIP
ncbi:hypothetical protein GOODEAATRI_010283 [Goodea atripinnis]|uniref:Uncharacterized protein n=1 Tax=Goodea atripinnis TaxID=208336 RepID=A0ABV0PCX1_9TELE